jgi:hypothetical protein
VLVARGEAVVFEGAVPIPVVSALAISEVALELDPWIDDNWAVPLPIGDASGAELLKSPGRVAVPSEPSDTADELSALTKMVGVADGTDKVVARTVSSPVKALLRLLVIVIVHVSVSMSVLSTVVVESGEGTPLPCSEAGGACEETLLSWAEAVGNPLRRVFVTVSVQVTSASTQSIELVAAPGADSVGDEARATVMKL